MSGAIGRMRAWLKSTAVGDVARVHGAPALVVNTDDVAALVDALDATELARFDAAHSAEHWEESHDIERTRADAAEAECERLRTERAVLIAERDDARMMARCCEENWHAARAEGDAARLALSALAEGADVTCLAEHVGAQECTAEEPCAACLAGDRADALRAQVEELRAYIAAATAERAAAEARERAPGEPSTAEQLDAAERALASIRDAVELPDTATLDEIVAGVEEQAYGLAGWEATQ